MAVVETQVRKIVLDVEEVKSILRAHFMLPSTAKIDFVLTADEYDGPGCPSYSVTKTILLHEQEQNLNDVLNTGKFPR